MNNKALGSNTMKVREHHQAFLHENYGGRKGPHAPEVGLNACLTYDSVRGRHGCIVVMSNDAQGSYDQIAHTVLQLALLCLGIPKLALRGP